MTVTSVWIFANRISEFLTYNESHDGGHSTGSEQRPGVMWADRIDWSLHGESADEDEL